MKKLSSFIKNMLSADKPESAKRFFGGIGFICSIVFIGCFANSLIDMLLITSASLIGLETITKIFNRK